ncbi:hypothetical protein ACO0K1_14900 [Undibacterium sp. SXout20W]
MQTDTAITVNKRERKTKRGGKGAFSAFGATIKGKVIIDLKANADLILKTDNRNTESSLNANENDFYYNCSYYPSQGIFLRIFDFIQREKSWI